MILWKRKSYSIVNWLHYTIRSGLCTVMICYLMFWAGRSRSVNSKLSIKNYESVARLKLDHTAMHARIHTKPHNIRHQLSWLLRAYASSRAPSAGQHGSTSWMLSRNGCKLQASLGLEIVAWVGTIHGLRSWLSMGVERVKVSSPMHHPHACHGSHGL
jgi:hypothetical protein